MGKIVDKALKAVIKAVDVTQDATQTITTTRTDRAGYSIERVGKLIDAGVSRRTIASQMADNSSNNQSYTETDVQAYAKLWEDVKTKVVITKAQTTALINDNKEDSFSGFQPCILLFLTTFLILAKVLVLTTQFLCLFQC